MPGPALLDAQPPEAGKHPEPPPYALAQGLQLSLTELWIFGILMRVGECHGDDPTLVGPEGSPVNARHTPEEVPAAGPGESPDPPSDASTANRIDSAPTFTTLERDLG